MNTHFCHKWFLAFISVLFAINAIAQTVSTSAPSSIQGRSGVALFTGRMLYHIPIYSIEDPDFHMDIALQYNAEGFKPFQPSGCYGQSWTLIAGGYISRTEQDLADEEKYTFYKPGVGECIQYGFLRAFEFYDGYELPPEKEQVFDLEDSICDTCGIYFRWVLSHCKYRKIDYTPDIFQFNFCGYKGRFMINNSGKVVILNGDYVDVDLSEMSSDASNIHNYYVTPNHNSKITIRTMDGYTYRFGGEAYSMEYALLTNRGACIDQKKPSASAWYLTQIIAPNGRELNFEYSPGISYSNRPNSLQSFYTNYDWTEQSINEDSAHIVYSLQKECLLKSIKTNDSNRLEIRFFESAESKRMYENSSFTYCVPHSQVDSIIVKYGDEKRRTVYLDYQYKSFTNEYDAFSDYYWRYLRQVYISGVGKYIMRYNVFDPYSNSNPNPSPNMGYNSLFWYPNLYPRTNSAYLNKVDRFGFWKVSSLQGMLSEVSLPTGGKLRFTYGEHQYGEERKFRIIGTQDVELFSQTNENLAIGGARIEKIETFSDDSTLVESKTFSYQKQGTTTSSGIFYNYFEVFNPSNPAERHPIANPDNYGMLTSHIGYSYVTQNTTIGSETFKTTYTFETGHNAFSTVGDNLIHRDSNFTSDFERQLCSGSLTYNGRLKMTGKLLAVDQYKRNLITKSTRFKYNGIPSLLNGDALITNTTLGNTDTIVCLHNNSFSNIARKLLVCPDVLEKVTTTEYDTNGDALVSSTTNTYDSKLRIKQTTFLDGQGVKYFTKYTYPDDVPGSEQLNGYPSPLFILCHSTANRIGDPVETISGYIENNTEYITEGKIKIYGMNTYAEGNALHFVPYLNKTMSLSLSSPITTYTYMSALNSQVTYDERYRLDCEYYYDAKLRPLSVKPYGGVETRYTWNGIYPVSKTVGNQTITYTYIPYVGVSSMTDPRGITTYYTYDSAGRLIETYQIINDRKVIINAYKYHTKTE